MKKAVHFNEQFRIRQYDPVSTPNSLVKGELKKWQVEWITPQQEEWENNSTHPVQLRRVVIDLSERVVKGLIWVDNLSFEKTVLVRWSLDGWKTYQDCNAAHSLSVNAMLDQFQFRLEGLKEGRLEMAVCFRCVGVEYWDNCNGQNYTAVIRRVLVKEQVKKLNDFKKNCRDWAVQKENDEKERKSVDRVCSPFYQGVRPPMESLLRVDAMDIGITLHDAMQFTSKSSFRDLSTSPPVCSWYLSSSPSQSSSPWVKSQSSTSWMNNQPPTKGTLVP